MIKSYAIKNIDIFMIIIYYKIDKKIHLLEKTYFGVVIIILINKQMT